MTPNAATPRVFLSHSSVDKPFVRLLADELRAFGAAIWLDELELALGDLLTERIGTALREASHLIACVSPHSIASAWVQREIAMGESLRVSGGTLVIMPVLFGSLTNDQMPALLRDRVYADCRLGKNYEAALRAILRRLAVQDLAPLPFDAIRAQRFIAAAAPSTDLRDWIVDYLGASSRTHPDATARHFLYRTLNAIGGPAADAYVHEGRRDRSEWARKGAEKRGSL